MLSFHKGFLMCYPCNMTVMNLKIDIDLNILINK